MAGIGKKKNTTRGGRRGGKKPTRGRPSPIKKTNDMKLENRDEEEAEVLSESSEEGGSHPIDEYLEYVKQLEKKHGYILEEQLSPRAEPDTKTTTVTTTSDSKAAIQKPTGVSEDLSLPPPRESLDAVTEQPPDGVILIEDDAEMLTSAEYRQFSRPVRYFDEDASVGSTCFKCGLVGHFARDCPNPAKQRPCFLCATFGHSSIKCPNTPCFRCGESGHMARDCLVKLDGWESSNRFICRRCGTNHCRASGPGDVLRAEGHCNQRYSDDDLRMVTCMSCGHVGHANCKGLASTDAIPSCYNCGDKGHIGVECKVGATPSVTSERRWSQRTHRREPRHRQYHSHQHHHPRRPPPMQRLGVANTWHKHVGKHDKGLGPMKRATHRDRSYQRTYHPHA
jgi:hypothetical protein